MIRCLVVDPVPNFEVVGKCSWVPKDVRDDDVPACSLMTWELIPSARRLFHSLFSWSHKSLILVHPALAMVRPSLNPLTLKGRPA